MSLLRRREKDSLDRRKSLACVPALVDGVRIVEADDGTITLKFVQHRGEGFYEMFRPATVNKKYELDPFGSFVVRQIGKRKNVLAIIKAFEARFGMSHRESELGVVAFIKLLMTRNVLSVSVERNSSK